MVSGTSFCEKAKTRNRDPGSETCDQQMSQKAYTPPFNPPVGLPTTKLRLSYN